MHSTMPMRRAEEDFGASVLLPPSHGFLHGTELRSASLYDKCLHLLSHLAGSLIRVLIMLTSLMS